MAKIGKGLLFAFVLLLVIGGISLYHFFMIPDESQTLHILLENSQNKMLDTTEEKNGFSRYQILDGYLYFEEEDGLYQYDYEENKKKRLWKEEIYDFKILEGKVYYGKFNDGKCSDANDDGDNFWDVACRDMGDLNEESLIEGVEDYIFSGEFIYFSRVSGGVRHIYQYDITTQNCSEIFSFDEFDEDGEEMAGEMILVVGNNLIFKEENLTSYNMEKNKWNICFDMSFQEEKLYFRIIDIQAKGEFLYVQGTVCDRTKSSIGGPYIVEDAGENGVWRVDINTGQREQITKTVYYGGIYVLDGMLYGIDDGRYEKIGE